MTRRCVIAPGEYYHVYNRGVDKRVVFTTKADYDRFLALLYICNGTVVVRLEDMGNTLNDLIPVDRGAPAVDICAYALMPNHFHLLLREKVDGGISKFMQKLMTGYTMYFNKRYKRTGALFQGRYRASHAGTDQYLSILNTYLHLNPVDIIEPDWKTKGIKNVENTVGFLKKYPHSSFPDFCGTDRIENHIINKNALPSTETTAFNLEKAVREQLLRPSSRFNLTESS